MKSPDESTMTEYLVMRLKPMCDDVIRKPTVENSKRLFEEITANCTREKLISSQDVILLPLLTQIAQLDVRFVAGISNQATI